MKVCPNCNRVYIEEARFCEDCGVALVENTVQNRSQTPPVSPVEQQPEAGDISVSMERPSSQPGVSAVNGGASAQKPPIPAPGYQTQRQAGASSRPSNTPTRNVQSEPGSAPMVLGIIGIVFALCLPIVTLTCSIIGLVLANNELNEGKTVKTTARTLNIIAVSIAGAILVLACIGYANYM